MKRSTPGPEGGRTTRWVAGVARSPSAFDRHAGLDPVRLIRRCVAVLLVVAACSPSSTPSPVTSPSLESRGPGPASASPGASIAPASRGPVVAAAGHPRLIVRAEDLERLRSWATDANPVYRDGLAILAGRARDEMDAGRLPGGDSGGDAYEEFPNEKYAELFAFMSLLSTDQGARDEWAGRARTLLMFVINEAAKGPADGVPFRDPGWATSDSDRSRYYGEAFPLTVDWIYPYLSADEKATIRKVFVRWAGEIVAASYQRPEPEGVINDPVLTSDPKKLRWAANNYFTAHMRNLGLMAMALDPADDPGNELGGYLANATGAWLLQVDHLFRTDAAGGLSPEGFEYAPQAMGYWVQFLLALHTAGRDDPATGGPQVVLDGNRFWDDHVASYLNSISPAPRPDEEWGQVSEPAWYGDGQDYRASDTTADFGALGIYDFLTGNTARLNATRWIVSNLAPGGADRLLERVAGNDAFFDAILAFLLFDPAAQPPSDPRPTMPLVHFAPGLGRLLARTGWDAAASWLTYSLSWDSIDHQHADGNTFEFYRHGEWLTKEVTGYDLVSSDYHNTLALENDPISPDHMGDYRGLLSRRGSQWTYNESADPKVLAMSEGQGYVAITGDATTLYGSDYEEVHDIAHSSRSLVWIQPDHVVIFDRADSKTPGRFKRFWLNLPTPPAISGRSAVATTASGQQLTVTSLLPKAAVLERAGIDPDPNFEQVANGEPMRARLRIEASGGPASVRFLTVLQGADRGVRADAARLIESSGGTAYAGAVVRGVAVLFPVDLGAPFGELIYTAPAGTSRHLVTGLEPGAGYDVSREGVSGGIRLTIRPGTALRADDGGVLVIEG